MEFFLCFFIFFPQSLQNRSNDFIDEIFQLGRTVFFIPDIVKRTGKSIFDFQNCNQANESGERPPPPNRTWVEKI